MTKPSVLDVARVAGVGPSTVSRVLNNQPYISQKARASVLAAVEALGYTPDLNARSLRRGQTRAISVLLPTTDTVFYKALLRSVQAHLEHHDYDLALFPLMGTQRIRRFREPDALLYRADALLIASQNPEQLYGGRPPFNHPVVLVDAQHPQYHSVWFDNRTAGRLAAELALRRGLPVVLLAGVADRSGDLFPSPVCEDRRLGVVEALGRQGVTPVRTLQVSPSFEGGRTAAVQLLAAPPALPVFLLAVNGEMALGAHRHLSEAGWRLGREYLLLGFDDSEQAAELELSSVSQPVSQIGEAAAEALVLALAGRLHVLTQRVFAPTLKERRSTARLEGRE